jgi:Tol biopolymer transport system component
MISTRHSGLRSRILSSSTCAATHGITVLAQTHHAFQTTDGRRSHNVMRIPSEQQMHVFRLAIALLPLAAATASAQMQMTNTGGGRPSVSPNGKWIVYSAARKGEWELYAIHPDGSGDRRITNVAERNFVSLGPPTWIGDRVLVFRRVSDTTRLSLIDPPSSPNDGPIPTANAVQVLVDALQVRPSPDGRRVVFLHGDRRRPRVAVANVDGTGLYDLTDSTVVGVNPDWSRDGKRIAFTVMDSASHGQIAVVDADGTNYHVITHLDPTNGLPQWANWAPDGKRLVIQAGIYNRQKVEESTARLWLVDVATGQAMKLAPHASVSLDETPSWFPDGKRIAFQSNRTGVMQVWTMNADGTDAHQVTSLHQ